MEASIQEVARLTGTTSRTLRHYDDIGLLPPSRVGANGYRWYDDDALVRLQRILLLRELGLGLDPIRRLLDEQADELFHARSLEHEDHFPFAEEDAVPAQTACSDRVRRPLREDLGRIVARAGSKPSHDSHALVPAGFHPTYSCQIRRGRARRVAVPLTTQPSQRRSRKDER